MVSLYNPIQCFTKWETLKEEKNTGTHLFYTFQPLHRGNIPLSPLLDLRKDPWFDQRSSRDHHSIHATPLHFLIIGCGRKTITVSKDGNRGKVGVSNGLAEGGDAVFDVFPVGRFGIALLARSTVNSQSARSPLSDETRNQLVSIWFSMRNTSSLYENVTSVMQIHKHGHVILCRMRYWGAREKRTNLTVKGT